MSNLERFRLNASLVECIPKTCCIKSAQFCLGTVRCHGWRKSPDQYCSETDHIHVQYEASDNAPSAIEVSSNRYD